MACEACRRRKVRCNGALRCQQCTHLGLRCQYNTSKPDAKSRKNVQRSHIVNSLKLRPPSTHRHTEITSVSPADLPRSREADLYTSTLSLDDLAEDYDAYVFTFVPIIPKQQYIQAILDLEHDNESAALVHALGAMTLNMRPRPDQNYENIRSEVMVLTTRAIELRGTIAPHHKLSNRTATISAAISSCLLAHHTSHETAFFYLREAITLTQILVTAAPTASAPDPESMRQRERLYWLLFVHERFVAISLFREPVLPCPKELVNLPEDSELTSGIATWFTTIIRLFSTLDQIFIDNWIAKEKNPSLTLRWIEERQAHLDQVMSLLQQDEHILTEMQLVDLIATDLWLRTLLWKLALSGLLLTNNSSTEATSIFFPLRLSRKLRDVLHKIPHSAFDVHGAGMLEKIFDVTNTFADILAYLPISETVSDVPEKLSDFLFLRNYLHDMSRFGQAERAILVEKTGILMEKFELYGMSPGIR